MGTSENVSWYGGGGIRTHGALADTLVFKTIYLLLMPIDLRWFKEQSCPKVARYFIPQNLKLFELNLYQESIHTQMNHIEIQVL